MKRVAVAVAVVLGLFFSSGRVAHALSVVDVGGNPPSSGGVSAAGDLLFLIGSDGNLYQGGVTYSSGGWLDLGHPDGMALVGTPTVDDVFHDFKDLIYIVARGTDGQFYLMRYDSTVGVPGPWTYLGWGFPSNQEAVTWPESGYFCYRDYLIAPDTGYLWCRSLFPEKTSGYWNLVGNPVTGAIATCSTDDITLCVKGPDGGIWLYNTIAWTSAPFVRPPVPLAADSPMVSKWAWDWEGVVARLEDGTIFDVFEYGGFTNLTWPQFAGSLAVTCDVAIQPQGCFMPENCTGREPPTGCIQTCYLASECMIAARDTQNGFLWVLSEPFDNILVPGSWYMDSGSLVVPENWQGAMQPQRWDGVATPSWDVYLAAPGSDLFWSHQ